MDQFDFAVAFTFREEGGYVNDPADPGGPTNMGVTLETMKAALGSAADLNHDGQVDAEDVKRLTRDQAREIYRRVYWLAPHFDLIPDPRIAAVVFDMGVNANPRVSTVLLQRAISHTAPPGVAHPRDDGALGSATLAALAACDQELVLAAFRSERKGFYLGCIERDPKKARFKAGWLARADRVPERKGAAA